MFTHGAWKKTQFSWQRRGILLVQLNISHLLHHQFFFQDSCFILSLGCSRYIMGGAEVLDCLFLSLHVDCSCQLFMLGRSIVFCALWFLDCPVVLWSAFYVGLSDFFIEFFTGSQVVWQETLIQLPSEVFFSFFLFLYFIIFFSFSLLFSSFSFSFFLMFYF